MLLAMVQRLLPRANVHESYMLVGPSTRGHQAWAPHERGIRLFTTLVDSRAKRGVGARNTGYFFLAFFSRICSKNNIHEECATLYLINEIDFGNSDAGFVIPTPKLP